MTDDQALVEFYDHLKQLREATIPEDAIGLADLILEKAGTYSNAIETSLLHLFSKHPPTTPEWNAIFRLFALFQMTTVVLTLTDDSLAFSPIARDKDKREKKRSHLNTMLRSMELAGNKRGAETAAEALRKLDEEEAKGSA